MKKLLLFLSVLLVISIVACKPAAKEVMEKKEEVMEKTPEIATETTGEAVVDAVGNDLNNANNDEKDLGIDELGDLDSGLADIQNI